MISKEEAKRRKQEATDKKVAILRSKKQIYDAKKDIKPFPDPGTGMFYSVKYVPDVLKLLTLGRRLRWRSTGAEYGLIEAYVVVGAGEVNVQDVEVSVGPGGWPVSGGQGEIYIEQVVEIYMTPQEYQEMCR